MAEDKKVEVSSLETYTSDATKGQKKPRRRGVRCAWMQARHESRNGHCGRVKHNKIGGCR